MTSPDTPAPLWDQAWQLILRGKADKKHAFNTPTFTTVGADGSPRSRTVVLRDVSREQNRLTLWTDVRSDKATHIIHNQQIAWHFWDRRSKIQVMAGGTAHLAPEDDKTALFGSLPKHSRKAYATLYPPGTPQASGTSDLPADWEQLPLEETDYVNERFLVLHTELTWADVLLLDRAGHRRMTAERSDGDWSLSWVTP